MAVKPTPIEQRFWAKVRMPLDPYDCWEWTAATSTGYGVMGRGGRKEGLIGAHVFSFLLFNEFIPDGEEVCHSCNNRRCVNPYHLYAGTRKDNMQQAQRQGRLKQPYRPW
jgi:hypothetical protein